MKIGIEHGIDKKDIRAFWKSLEHDVKYNTQNDMRLPIYSNISGSYQMDTLVQTTNAKVRYFLVFININSRKAYAYPMSSKGSKACLQAIKAFINDAQDVQVITSDEDKAYLSNEIQSFFINNRIQHRTTDDDNHNILGIINRFIRTLRDMNERRDFTKERMKTFIEAHNDTVNNTTGVKPDNFDDEAEKEWIDKKSAETNAIKNSNSLQNGVRVRYITDKNPLKKRRLNLSKNSYEVNVDDGNAYILMAKDKSTMRMPRYRLVVCRTSVPLAKSIRGGKSGIIEKIIDWDSKKRKYEVKYEGCKKYDKIPPMNLRRGAPTRLSIAERDYWKNKDDMPDEFKKLIY